MKVPCEITSWNAAEGPPQGQPVVLVPSHTIRGKNESTPFEPFHVLLVEPCRPDQEVEKLISICGPRSARARVITFLVDKGLLRRGAGPDSARLGPLRLQRPPSTPGALPRAARTWNASPNTSSATPFRSKRLRATEPGPASASGSILYRCGMNKIGGNFEVFTPCDFIAAITQHIPDGSFQFVRYYGCIPTGCAAGEPCRRTKKCRPRRRRGGDRRFRPRAAPHPFQEVARVIKNVWEADAAVPEVLTGTERSEIACP